MFERAKAYLEQWKFWNKPETHAKLKHRTIHTDGGLCPRCRGWLDTHTRLCSECLDVERRRQYLRRGVNIDA